MILNLKSKIANHNVKMDVTDICVSSNIGIGFKGGGGGSSPIDNPENHYLVVRYSVLDPSGHKYYGEHHTLYLPSKKLELTEYVKNEFENNHPNFGKVD